jgi:membrane-associated phospholipid phosphatase
MNFLFDTKLNHFLQSFPNPVLTVFMLGVSVFGSQPFLMLAAGFIFFRVGWKRGFVFVQIVLWSFILTDFLKELLYLPRPVHVDPSLLTFNEFLPTWLLESIADNPGFPSGHVCSTVVFWGAVLMSFPGRFQKILAVALIILMPFSRMYLGRHFLGDVLGGLLLGLLILLAGSIPLIRSQRDPMFLKNHKSILFAGYLVLLLLLNVISLFHSTELGQLFGFNIAIFCILFFDFFKRSLIGQTQFMVAVLIFVLIQVVFLNLNFVSNRWIHFVIAAIPTTCAILGASIFGKFSNRVGI